MPRGQGAKLNNIAKELLLPELAVADNKGYEEAVKTSSQTYKARAVSQGGGKIVIDNRIAVNGKESKLKLPVLKLNL